MIPKFKSSAAAAALALALPLISGEPALPGPSRSDLAAVREASAKFRNVGAAIADGYLRNPIDACVTARLLGPEAGGQSPRIYYFRPDLVGLNAPAKAGEPNLIVYEPRPDGSLALIAVAKLTAGWAWRDEQKDMPARISGLHLDAMRDDPSTKVDEASMFVPRYTVQAWVVGKAEGSSVANASCGAGGQPSKASV